MTYVFFIYNINNIHVNIGGQETTALVNACVIFMLAHHQDVQDKVNIYIYKLYKVTIVDSRIKGVLETSNIQKYSA